MRRAYPFRLRSVVLVFLCCAMVGSQACGQPVLRSIYDAFQGTKRALHRSKPHSGADRAVEELAQQIDWLEHHIDAQGSIVAKHPDVWGQARLTKHRQEFEREMAKMHSTEKFRNSLQGAMRRSDQSFLSQALSLQSAANAGQTGDESWKIVDDPNAPGQQIITRTASGKVDLSNFGNRPISLEPSTISDQMKRYFDHLNELRRINEGDDTADSPGYSLNLVRVPVSVLPGKQTRQGYGGEITVTVEPYVTDELLPMTFKNLVINDIVDLLSLPLAQFLNRPDASSRLSDFRAIRLQREAEELYFRRYIEGIRGLVQELRSDAQTSWWFEDIPPWMDDFDLPDITKFEKLIQQSANQYEAHNENSKAVLICREILRQKSENDQRTKEVLAGLSSSQAMVNTFTMPLQVAHRNRQARHAVSAGYLEDIIKWHGFATLAYDANDGLRPNARSASPQQVHIVDVRRYLRTEVEAAYEVLARTENIGVWDRYCTPTLTALIRNRRVSEIEKMRQAFFNDPSVRELSQYGWTKATRTLAWTVIVEAVLLNEQLIEDMKHLSVTKGCLSMTADWLPFYSPDPPYEAQQAFQEYVRCRWPVIVFALDPVTQDQNIADVFARRRELQLAASVAVTKGEMSARSASQFVRRLETDIETISLNRTDIAFSHGNDSFGWRFYPRFQSPPVPGTFGSVTQTLFGSDSGRNVKTRELEPGIRECVAIVIMPSFVPYLSISTRSSWFQLHNPSERAMNLHEAMQLSRNVQAVRTFSQQVCAGQSYRPGDVAQLMRAVDQLDRRLPLQEMLVQIPYENTLGGFEMFSTGVTDLAPELYGWHGAPGVRAGKAYGHYAGQRHVQLKNCSDHQCRDTHSGTTLFLVGDGFSVHDTQVIAGGQWVPYQLLSRQVMRVTIPETANVLTNRASDGSILSQVVDVHVATPYGVSSHLYIPVHDPPAAAAAAIERRIKKLTSNHLFWDAPEIQGTFVYGPDGFMIPESIRIDGDARYLENRRFAGDTNRLLMAPRFARMAFRIQADSKTAFDTETTTLLTADGLHAAALPFDYTTKQGGSVVIPRDLLERHIQDLVRKRVEARSPRMNRALNSNAEELSFNIETLVRLDEDSQPLQTGNVFRITLRDLNTRRPAPEKWGDPIEITPADRQESPPVAEPLPPQINHPSNNQLNQWQRRPHSNQRVGTAPTTARLPSVFR